jgi:hypothetical protein
MRPTQRLTAVASELSTVRMIDKLSLQLSVFWPLQGACRTKAAGWTHSLLHFLRRHRLDARGVSRVLPCHLATKQCPHPASRRAISDLRTRPQICFGASLRSNGALRMRVAAEGPAAVSRLSYFAARSSNRRLVNSSVFSARLRHRSACALRKFMSMASPLTPSFNFAQRAGSIYGESPPLIPS